MRARAGSQPTKYQKIHWKASKGLNNTGAIRFVKGEKKNTCTVTLTISYEVPQVHIPPCVFPNPSRKGSPCVTKPIGLGAAFPLTLGAC